MALPEKPIVFNEEPLRVGKPRSVTHKHNYGKISRYFYGLREKKLLGTRCAACGITFLPPYADCPDCWAPTEWVELPQEGIVATFVRSVMYPGAGYEDDIAHYGERLPTIVAYIELPGVATKIMSWIRNCDPEKVHIGMKVRAHFAPPDIASLTALDLWWEPVRES